MPFPHINNPNYFGHSGPRPNISKAKLEWYKTHDHPLLGKKHTQETKDKIAAAHLGEKELPFSEEHRRKISEGQIGKKLSEETKHKISLARINRNKLKPKKVEVKNEEKKPKPVLVNKPKPKPMKKRKTKPKLKKKHTGARRGSYEWKEQMSISKRSKHIGNCIQERRKHELVNSKFNYCLLCNCKHE